PNSDGGGRLIGHPTDGPWARPGLYSGTMTSSQVLESPLVVGRDSTLGLVKRQIDDARAGRGSMLLFAGEAGIGKTRLIRAALRQATALGFRVSKGDLAPQDLLVALASISDLARTMRSETFGDLGPDLLAM